MKRMRTVFIFIILYSTMVNAQWYSETSGVSTYLYGVCFINVDTGWAVGDSGTILNTTDGGVHWNSQTSKVSYSSLKSISFSDATHGWATGKYGAITRTTDGGTSWTPQTSNVQYHVWSVSAANTSTGWAVCDSGTVLRTTDGGANWIQQTSGTLYVLNGVSSMNVNTATAVGDSGMILRTTNSGTNWIQQTSGTLNNLIAVSFTDVNNGSAVGQNGKILRTTDGGATWTSQTSGTNNLLKSVSFTDATHGTAVGQNGTILKTTDGGAHWTAQTSPTTNNLNAVSFADSTHGTAIGALGTILGTTNGGALPVELASFSASVVNNTVNLTWKTATEVNNYGFDVERSTDNRSWQKIGFVGGSGNSNSPKDYSFTDSPSGGGTSFSYRLKQIDVDGNFKYYDAVTVNLTVSNEPQLMQNSPNPFNPSTTIKFYIPNTSDVTIKIYDMLGREVTNLINQQTTAGYHIVYWNGKNSRGENVSSGIYLYRLTAGSFSETKKMNLLK